MSFAMTCWKQKVDVLQVITHPKEIVKVEERRGPIGSRARLDEAHGLAGRGKVDAVPTGPDGALRITAVINDLARGVGDDVLDERAREAKPAVGIQMRPLGDREFPQVIRRMTDADVREQ